MVGLGFVIREYAMNFFDELLNSYDLLKKRKLRVTLNEQSPGQINVDIFTKRLSSGEDTAVEADKQADIKLQALLPGYPANQCVASIGKVDYPIVSQVEGGYAYQNEAGKMVKFASEGGDDCKYKINASKINSLKNHIAVGIYPTLLGQAAAEDGLNPEAGLVMGGPVTDLANDIEEVTGPGTAPVFAKLINSLWGQGEGLKAKIQPMIDAFPALKTYLEEGAGSPKGRQQIVGAWFNPDNATSIFGVAIATLKNKEAIGASISNVVSDTVENVTPNEQDVANYFSNLDTVLGIVRKSWKDVSSEEKQFMTDTVRVLSVETTSGKKKGVRDTVFIKVNDEDNLGISLDGAKGNKQSGLAILLQDYQEKVNAAQEEAEYSVTTKELNEVAAAANSSSTKVVTDLSEDIDTIMSLMRKKKSKEATAMFRGLWDKYSDNLLSAANIVKAAEDGEIAYDSNILGIQETLMEFGGDEEDMKRSFLQIVQNVGARRAQLIAKLQPTAVLRVGSRTGAGESGFKSDQFYMWNKSEYEANKENIKKYKGTIKEYKSLDDMKKDGFTEDEIKTIKDRGIDFSEGVYVNPISMKWTRAEDKVKLGETPGPANITRDLLDRTRRSSKPSQTYEKMLSFVGATTPEARVAVLDAAEELNNYMGIVENMKSGNALSDPAPEFLAAMNKELSEVTERDILMGFLKSRTPGKDIEGEKPYRKLAAMFIARGAWDKDNATDHYEFTGDTNKTFVHNRNDFLKSQINDYIDGGTNGNISDASITMGGVGFTASVSNKNTGTMRGQTQVRGTAVKGSGGEQLETEASTEEMYKFFQKLYEALTSVE
jgi:hypothetical protein